MSTNCGHAPSNLRDAFTDAIAAFDIWNEAELEPTVEHRDRTLTISQVCGLLWNCTDTLPAIWCKAIERMQRPGDPAITQGATYAQAARALRSMAAERQGIAA